MIRYQYKAAGAHENKYKVKSCIQANGGHHGDHKFLCRLCIGHQALMYQYLMPREPENLALKGLSCCVLFTPAMLLVSGYLHLSLKAYKCNTHLKELPLVVKHLLGPLLADF